jgi:hypothetical protein
MKPCQLRICIHLLLSLFWSLGAPAAHGSNDVLPRLLTNVPVDLNWLSVGYTYSTGNVSVDPSLALDVEADLHTYTMSYTRSFAAFGQSASFSVAVPYADLTLAGIVQGEAVTAQDDRFADPRFRLAFNLSGAPALSMQEFGGYRQKTIIGFGIGITAPLGHYDETRAVNFGANRWAIVPELGMAHRFKRFTLEGAATVAFFSDNDEYLIDQTLKQEPIAAIRANLIYHFRRPGTWLGFSTLYLRGGETSIDGVDRQNLQSTSRAGISLSLPFARRHNLLLRYSRGVTTRIGADFDNYSVNYTFRF